MEIDHDCSAGTRSDTSLVPLILQTASFHFLSFSHRGSSFCTTRILVNTSHYASRSGTGTHVALRFAGLVMEAVSPASRIPAGTLNSAVRLAPRLVLPCVQNRHHMFGTARRVGHRAERVATRNSCAQQAPYSASDFTVLLRLHSPRHLLRCDNACVFIGLARLCMHLRHAWDLPSFSEPLSVLFLPFS